MPTPPSPPSLPKKSTLFHAAASFCVWSPLIAIGFNIFVPKVPVHSQSDALANALIAGFVPVAGILAGVFAFFGIPRHGKKGILWKSVAGLSIWALLAALALPTFLKVQERARMMRDQNSQAATRIELWSSSAPDQWPQLVLTNSATFKGHSALHGASGFLIYGDSGAIHAATARHLLGKNGGVEPEVTLLDFDKAFDSWSMYPRTRPDEHLKIVGSATFRNSPLGNDWLILRAEAQSPPAKPLHIRPSRVKVGEHIHLVGVSYAEPEVAQKVYSGTVTARGAGDRFRYDISPHVDISGFSGAPIVDDAGLCVGVMTVWFQPRMDGRLYEEAGGEDAASALAVMTIGK